MQMECLSHIGAVRQNNEDSVFADASLGLLIVADGIGGQDDGEVASSIAVTTVVETVKDNFEHFSLDILKEAFFEANHTIYRLGKNDSGKPGMGTTMTALWLNPEIFYLVHVGDSRAYICEQNLGQIRQLTDDHSLAGELVKDGSITPEEALHHPQRHLLTRSLGHEPLVQPDAFALSWQKGDVLLLCSDGLYGLVNPNEILTLLQDADGDLAVACRQLVELALQRGGYDNITVALACND